MNNTTWLPTILHRLLVIVAFPAVFTSVTATATANPLFVMDPGVRNLPGSMEQRYKLIHDLGYAGVSINDASLNGIDQATSTAAANDMKVFAVYLSTRLTTASLVLPPHFDGICERLGKYGGLVWLYVDGKAFKPSDQSADSIALPALKQAAEVAARHGTRIALYPHRDYWIESFADALRVADMIDHPNLGVSFNLAHSLYAGEEAEIFSLLDRAGSRLFVVSLNGADFGAAAAGWDRLIQPLGMGSYDVPALRAHLRKINYVGPIGLQTFAIKMDPAETLRISMDAWRSTPRLTNQRILNLLRRHPGATLYVAPYAVRCNRRCSMLITVLVILLLAGIAAPLFGIGGSVWWQGGLVVLLIVILWLARDQLTAGNGANRNGGCSGIDIGGYDGDGLGDDAGGDGGGGGD